MGEAAKKYLKDVKVAFPIAYKDEKRFLRDMEDSVCTYEEEHPECSREELYEEFGDPREIALGYFQETSVDVYLGMMKRSKNIRQIKTAVIAVLAIALAMVSGFCIYSTQKYKSATGSYIEEEVQPYESEESGE